MPDPFRPHAAALAVCATLLATVGTLAAVTFQPPRPARMPALVASAQTGHRVVPITPPPPKTPSASPQGAPEATAAQRGSQRLGVAAQAVADCESGDRRADGTAVPGSFDPSAHNPTSSASGAWQFLDGTWTATTGLSPPAAAHPLPVQREAFRRLWDGGRGASHWRASRRCWQGRIR